ncbi:MAG: DNA replication/repair protein RecF [Clostridia bacterium]|nr:DNA replication/repair protein RecF [Clostridia bacterium]
MNVERLSIENFRNIEKMNIEPCDKVNIIYGENAQGKTNTLESIWLCTGCRSFRGTKDKELIRFGEERAKIELDFYGFDRHQQMKVEIDDKRKVQLNGVQFSSANKSLGEFLAVVFSPTHLSLIKQGPSERRRFLDTAIGQLRPNYASLLTKYNRAVTQRNAILKDAYHHPQLLDTLDIWEDSLAAYGERIMSYRLSYLEKLKEEVKVIYSGLSCGKEEIGLEYLQDEEKGIVCTSKDEFREILKNGRKTDMLTGTTSFGPHRDDIDIKINGISARRFGSQGQQRSCALALKLGEASMIKKVSSQQPVALLDDVMSELDISRQDYILNHIKDWQVFITCCDPNTILHLKEGKTFKIEGGEVR